MEFTTCYCPHPQCTHYGQRGFGTHLVHCGADRGIPRLLCTMCRGTFSVRQGTAYFGVRAEEPNDTIAMRALAEGNSLRGTGRIVLCQKGLPLRHERFAVGPARDRKRFLGALHRA
jgi:hypothetical protein